MDIHPPQQPVHTVKDFLLHLLTITVGLFIALTLEASIESVHHRHLVRDARQSLQSEIETNHKLYAKNAQDLRQNREQLAHDIDQLRQLREGKKLDNPVVVWDWDWISYADSVWATARESGAVPYMNPKSISATHRCTRSSNISIQRRSPS